VSTCAVGHIGGAAGRGGTTSNYSVPLQPNLCLAHLSYPTRISPSSPPTNVTGGNGGSPGIGSLKSRHASTFSPTRALVLLGGGFGGGGGGGGRGNAGNAGGCGGAGGCGVAGTPATFNCVPVTPGCTAPITVASPGGQIVISWNPQ
jgi:hypothetical protein